jgi:anti-sigma factor (TIGR02949 family)
MNCREFVDFLMAYLDQELERETRGVFERHMDACPSCRDYLTTYEDTIRAGQLACNDQDEIPADVPEKLIEAILADGRGRS